MKVVLLGKKGMLGDAILKRFILKGDKKDTFYAFDRSELDVLDKGKVFDMIKTIKPNLLINCVAYTDVEKAEFEEKDLAYKLNAHFLTYLSDYLNSISSTLVHFSTDFVFDGKKNDFYVEDDIPSPLNEYGASKLLGEENIKNNIDKHYIIRTAWLYGSARMNFVDMMLQLAKEKKELKAVQNLVGSPTNCNDLADYTLNNFVFSENKAKYGIFHGVNEGYGSKYDLIKKAFDIKKVDTNLIPVDSSEFPSKVSRPNFSALKDTKLTPMRNWEDALTAYLK